MFATSTKPEPIASRTTRWISYGLGFWATLLAATQMVSFEDFVDALRQYRLGGEGMTLAIAIGLIGLEIFAVPFLFRLSLSRAGRLASALFAALLPFAWTVLTLHAFLINATVSNAGYFGGFARFQAGGLAVALDVAWIIVMSWACGPLGVMKAFNVKRR